MAYLNHCWAKLCTNKRPSGYRYTVHDTIYCLLYFQDFLLIALIILHQHSWISDEIIIFFLLTIKKHMLPKQLFCEKKGGGTNLCCGVSNICAFQIQNSEVLRPRESHHDTACCIVSQTVVVQIEFSQTTIGSHRYPKLCPRLLRNPWISTKREVF